MTPVTLSEEGELSAAELARGCRLACLTEPLSDCRVHVPGESVTALQRTQLEGLEVPAEVDRSVVNCVVQMALPTLDGLRGDDKRICEAASAAAGPDTALPDLEVARGANTELRKLGWRARVTLRGRKI